MKAVRTPISRLLRDLFRLEPLEPRLLMSADPVVAAAQAIVRPPEETQALVDAYTAQADLVVATPAGSTVLVTNGPAKAAQADWLVVDISQLHGGHGTVVIGDVNSNAKVLLGEAGGAPIALDNLVIVNPQAGGEIFQNVDLSITGSFLVQGSGHTTTLSGTINNGSTPYILADSLKAATALTINTSSNVQLGSDPFLHIISGDTSGANNDTFTLNAGGIVEFVGSVGAAADGDDGSLLQSLTIDAFGGTNLPDKVTFDRPVRLAGDLVIRVENTGTVTFKDDVELTNGGNLYIYGANTVEFQTRVTLSGTRSGAAGNIILEGNIINLPSNQSSVAGSGTITMRPTDKSKAIELGLPIADSSALNLDMTELRALKDGFATIVVGWESGGHALTTSTLGNVSIGGNTTDQMMVRDNLVVYGKSIQVQDNPVVGIKLRVSGTITLDAVQDITIQNEMDALLPNSTGASDITLYAPNGSVVQSNTSGLDFVDSEPLHAANLTVTTKTGITLPFTDIAGVLVATNATSGDILINELSVGGDLTISQITQQAPAGAVTVTTSNGCITVAGCITSSGSGLTSIEAKGTGKTLVLNQLLSTNGGAVSLKSPGTVTVAGSGAITVAGTRDITIESTAGSVVQDANLTSAGGTITVKAAQAIVMTDGLRIQSLDPVGDTGKIVMQAGGDANISIANADGEIRITAGGAIRDNLTGTAPNLDGDTAVAYLTAASGIGASALALQTRVATLGANVTASGGIFVREATALKLNRDTGTYAVDAAGGVVSITTVDGAITVEKAVRTTGANGHVLLQTGEAAEPTDATLAIRADITTTNGSVSLVSVDGVSVDDLAVNTAPTLTAGGTGQTMDVRAANAITMEATARMATAGGAARLVASGGSVALGVLDVGSGNASISASVDITDARADDNDTVPASNVLAGSVRLSAGGAIGAAGALLDTQVANLAAVASTGALFVSERDDATVGSIAIVSVNNVQTDGSLGTAADSAALANVSSAGVVVLQAGGNLTLDGNVSGPGNLRIVAGGKLDLSAGVLATSTGANVTAVAAGNLSLAGGARVWAQGGTLDIESTGGNVAMNATAVGMTNAANLRVKALDTITVGVLDARTVADRANVAIAGQAGWGDISIAGGTIADNAGESATDVFARSLRLQAAGGIGGGTEHLETEALTLSANVTAGGFFVTEATALTVGTTAAIAVNRIGSDGLAIGSPPSDGAQSGMASSGALVLQTTAGALSTTAAGVVTAGGNLLLKTLGTGTDLSLAGVVASTGGHISLSAAQDLLVSANVNATGADKTIDLLAQRHLTQAQGTAVTAAGNISAEAVGGNVTVETFDAGTRSIWIKALNIRDGDAAANTETDLVAASAQLLATTGNIGAAGASLGTSVTTLSAKAGTGLFILEANGVTVDLLQVDVQRVDAEGNVTAAGHAAQEDLSAPIVALTATLGDITVNAGTAATTGVTGGTGNVRLQAAAGNVSLASGVDAVSGSATVLGAAGVSFTAAGRITTTGGTIDVESSAGAVTMADGAYAQTGGGNIRVAALGSITVGVLDARTAIDRGNTSLAGQGGWGAVSVHAGGAIVDNSGETAVDVFASSLRLEGTGVGSGTEHLETEVALLSANVTTGGMFVTESTATSVGSVSTVSVDRIAADGTTVGSASDGTQAGITSTGAAVLRTTAGALTTTAQGAVNVSGNVLLKAGGDLTVGASIASSGGNVTVAATGAIAANANVSTAASGSTIELQATGAITQLQTTQIATTDGSLVVSAGGIVTIELLSAGSGAVHVQGSSIVDGDAANDTEPDILAGTLRLIGTNGIGAEGAQLETTVVTLAAASSAGNVFVTETDELVVGTLANVSVQSVAATGIEAVASYASTSGITGGKVVVRTVDGCMTTSGNGTVAARGTLLLQAAGGTNRDLTVGTAVTAQGAASLAATRDLIVTSTGSVKTTVDGSTLDLLAARINAQEGSDLQAANANVQLVATGGTVTIEHVAAGTGFVRLSGTSIIDGDANGDSEVDVVAAHLQITASTGVVGDMANALETTVDRLTVSAAGNVSITETNDLALDTVVVTVDRVGADGNVTATANVSQSGVAGAATVVRTLAGSITSTAAGGVVAVTGNLLLKAAGTGADATLGGCVSSSGGNVSVDAKRDVRLNANVSNTASTLTVDVLAGGLITQAEGVQLTTANGNVSLSATGVVTVELVNAGSANVNISGSAIVDGDTGANEGEVDVVAGGLRLRATGGGIAGAANPLETTVTTLTARATGGNVFIVETDALDLGPVPVTVNRVDTLGVQAPFTPTAQSGTDGVDVVVRTLNGKLTGLATGGVVTATGNVLLQSGGSTSDVQLEASVISTAGNVSVVAGRTVEARSAIAANGTGSSITVLGNTSVTMTGTATMSAADGLRVQATNGVATITGLTAQQVQVEAGSTIMDAGDSSTDIASTTAWLKAGGDIGGFASAAAALDLAVGSLAALSTGGAIQLAEADAVTLGNVTVTAAPVDTLGVATPVTSARQLGLRTGAGGKIELRAGGTVTLASSDVQSAVITTGEARLISQGAILDNANAYNDIEAGDLFVQASGGAIGDGADDIEMRVTNLSANASAGVHLLEADAVTVTLLRGPVSGPLVVRSQQDLTVTGTVSATSGNVLLQSLQGNATVQSSVLASGHISLLAQVDVSMGSSGSLASSAGTVDIEAATGAVTMTHGAVAQSSGGDIRVKAAGNVTVGVLDARTSADRGNSSLAGQLAQWGNVSVLSTNGSVLDNTSETITDIYARQARLKAAAGIGTGATLGQQHLETEAAVLSADSGTAGLYLTEAGALEIGATGNVTVQQVQANGTTLAAQVDLAQAGLASGGAAVVVSKAAAMTVTSAVGATGNVLLTTQGTDLSVSAQVKSTSGAISLIAARDLASSAAVIAEGTGKSVDLRAARDLNQTGGSVTTADGNVWLAAVSGNLTVGFVNAGAAGVAASAAASIIDGRAAAGADIIADRLQLAAGTAIGTGADALDIQVVRVTSSSTNAGTFLSETDGVAVDNVLVGIDRVGSDGNLTAQAGTAQQGLAAGGALVLDAGTGALVLSATTGVVTSGGEVLLKAGTAVTALASVTATGNLSVVGASVEQQAAGDFTSTAGTIDVEATGGTLTMVDGAEAKTTGRNIRYAGSGTVTLGLLDARNGATQANWGAVSVRSGANVADIDGETAVDIYARELRFQATGGIATGAQLLETETVLLSANAGSGFYVQDASAVTIGRTATVDVTRVANTGVGAPLLLDDAQEDLVVTAGSATLTTVVGTLTVQPGNTSQAVDVSGALRLAAGGTGDLVTTGSIKAGGATSLVAGQDVKLGAAVAVTGSGSTLQVQAQRDVADQEGADLSVVNANVSVQAIAGNLTLESVTAGSGFVRLLAAGFIADGDTDGNEGEVDVSAAHLLLKAGGAIGSGTNALETSVDRLTAEAAGVLVVTESTELLLDTVVAGVNAVDAAGNVSAQATTTQSGLKGTNVVVRTLAGSLTSTVAGGVVTASGNVLLKGAGTGADVVLGGAVNAGGNVSVDAAHDVLQNANVTTTAAALTVDVLAGGAITQAEGVKIETVTGNVSLSGGSVVTVETINAAGAAVSLSGSAIVDGDTGGIAEAEVDVVADGLRVASTAGSIAASTNPLETTVTTLTARATGGHAFLTESNTLQLGAVAVKVNRIGNAGTPADFIPTAQEGVAGTDVVIRTAAGKLTNLAGTQGVVAATGNVLLKSGTSDVELNAPVSSTLGNVSVWAANDVLAKSSIAATGTDATLDVRAGAAVTMISSATMSADAGLRIQALGGNATITGLSAQGVQVDASASILDAGDTNLDITATRAWLKAGTDIGGFASPAAALDTSVGTLAAQAGGAIQVSELDTVTLGSVTVSVAPVNEQGTPATVTSAPLLGLRATAGGKIELRSGGTVTLASSSTLSALVTTGEARVISQGGIVDNANAYNDIEAGDLFLQAAGGAIGAGDDDIEMTVTNLSANASAGVHLLEADALTVTLLKGTAAGPLVVRSQQDLTVTGAVTAASGNVLLQSLQANASVQSAVTATGHISVLAQLDVLLGATAALVSSAGTMDIESVAAAVVMTHGALAQTSGADIRVKAAGNVTVGLLDARSNTDRANVTLVDQANWGSVSVLSTGAAIVDNTGETSTDVYARQVRLKAATGIATGATLGQEHLEVEGALLSADSGTGGLFVTEAGALEIGATGNVVVQQVQADGTTVSEQTDGAQAGLASGGAAVVVSKAAAMTVTSAVTAAGNVLLSAQGTDLGVSAQVRSTGGAISLIAANDLTSSAVVVAEGANKSVDLRAGHDVKQGSGNVTTANGNVWLAGVSGNVTVGLVSAGTAGVAVNAGAAIVDGRAAAGADIRAGQLQLSAGTGIATGTDALEIAVTTLASHTGAGGTFLAEADGVTVGSVQVGITRVGSDGGLTTQGGTAQQGMDAVGALVLDAGTGSLVTTVTTGALNVTGDLLLKAGAAVTAGAAVNASGNISVVAASVQQQAAGSFTSAAGTIDVEATGGAIQMADGAVAQTTGRNIRYAATQAVTLGLLDARTASDRANTTIAGQAGWGAVSVKAGTDIADLAGETAVDIYANELRLEATNAVGGGTQPLEMEAALLSAHAGSGFFMQDASALVIGKTVAVNVTRVTTAGGVDTTGDAVQEDLVVTLGNAVLGTTGALAVQAGDTDPAVTVGGALRLSAGGAAGDLSTMGRIGATGAITLLAGRDVSLGANVSATVSGSTLQVQAQRNLVDQEGATLSTVDANVSLQAVAGNITLEAVTAGTGTVRLLAGGFIADGDADGDTEVDVTAAKLLATAVTGIGTGANALETQVGTLTAFGGSQVVITESDALLIDGITAGVNGVAIDGNVSAQATSTQAGLDGTTVIVRTLAGSLETRAGSTVHGTASIRLEAGGTGDLTIGAAVSTSGGNVSLAAAHDLLQNASITNTAAGATIEMLAGHDLRQAVGVATTSSNGDVWIQAGATATIDSVVAGTADVGISAADIVDADSDSGLDVQAGGLLVLTGTGAAGSAANPLETAVGKLTASTATDLFVTEADAVQLSSVNVQVNAVQAGVADAARTAHVQANVAGRTVVVRTLAGSLTSDTDGAVTARGNLLLQAAGANSDLQIGAAVTNTTGNTSLDAGRDLALGANLTAQASGQTLDLLAARNIVQAQGTAASTLDGNIAVQSTGGNVTIETLSAGTAGVRIGAVSIIDGDAGGDTEADIVAAGAQLVATAAIGGAGAQLETNVTRVAASAGTGLFIDQAAALRVGTVQVNAQRVGAQGTATATANAATVGASAAVLVVRTTGGTLEVEQSGAVTATGDLLLRSASVLTVGAEVKAGGVLSIDAGTDLQLNANLTTTTSRIDAIAGGVITAAQGTAVASTSGNIQLQAVGNLVVETVSTAGDVRLAGAAIIDGDSGETDPTAEVDIIASGLLVTATQAIGTFANPLETRIATLSASAGGDIAIAEANGLTINAVTFRGSRTPVSGVSAPLADVVQSDVSTTSGNVRLVAQGTISMPADADVRTTGAGTVEITSVTGSVLMDPSHSSVVSGSGNITINAQLDIQPGALLTSGKAFVNAVTGKVLVAGDLQRAGEDIDLFGNDLEITVDVSSPGATLRIGPLDGSVPIVIGGPAPTGPALHVDTTELGHLKDGFSDIVIGSTLDNQSVQLEGTATPLVFRDPVVLQASGDGGTISVSGGLVGQALTIGDAGVGTTLTRSDIQMQGAVLVQDQVTVDGTNAITSGTLAAADIHVTQTITGKGGNTDTLALDANGGKVLLDKAVTNLDGMVITDATDVTFGAAVSLTGDLVITATGTVTFTGPVTMSNGAKLVVLGGGDVVFSNTANLGTGGAVLRVDSLVATGGVGSIVGSGVLELRGSNDAQAIHLGGGTGTAGSLSVGTATLQAIGNGFSKVQIGASATAGAGAVTIGDSDFTATNAPLEVLGSTITVNGAGPGLRVDTGLTLHAAGTVTATGKIVASANSAMVFTSDTGAIAMTNGASVTSLGGNIDLNAATGMALAGIDARGAGGTAGVVTIRSNTGVISDATGDTAIDIFARAIDFIGNGPVAGSGDALEVSALLVHVQPTAGVVLRESGSDGRVYYNILNGGQLSQAVVAVGPSARVTSDPDLILANTGVFQALVNAMPSGQGLAAQQLQALGTSGGLSGSAGATDSPQARSFLALAPGGAAPELSLSQRLLAETDLTFATGQATSDGTGIDWWLETLAV